MTERRSLWTLTRPLVLVGWVVATIRLALEFVAPEQAMMFGVYYVMPVILLALGVRRHFTGVGFWRFQLAMLVVAALVWVVPNCITYTVAQFMEWSHGRFRPPGAEFMAADDPFGDPNARGPQLMVTTAGKIGVGLMVGGLTGIAGTVWMAAWGTVVAWLPVKLLGRKP